MSQFDSAEATMHRADVLRSIDATYPRSPMILTLGGTAREMLAVAGRKPNHLVNLDAMGQTVSIALGVAVGLDAPDAESGADGKIVVVEGDGSMIMGLSVMSTVGHLKPRNLVAIILDNGVYLATGAQPTAAGDIDFCAVATACGWPKVREVTDAAELDDALAWAADAAGPVLLRVAVTTKQIPTDFFLEDPAVLAEDFRRWLRGRRSHVTLDAEE